MLRMKTGLSPNVGSNPYIFFLANMDCRFMPSYFTIGTLNTLKGDKFWQNISCYEIQRKNYLYVGRWYMAGCWAMWRKHTSAGDGFWTWEVSVLYCGRWPNNCAWTRWQRVRSGEHSNIFRLLVHLIYCYCGVQFCSLVVMVCFVLCCRLLPVEVSHCKREQG